MVPEIWSVTDRIFCQFGPFFVLLPPFFVLLPFNNPENQDFENMKYMPGDIIILYMCTINANHMMYGSWYMECDEQNFLSFWTVFCPFTPVTTWKIKCLKKWKKCLEISSFYMSAPKSSSYATLFLRYYAWRMKFLFFISGYFLPFYPPNNPKIKNLKKWKKISGDIIILHTCTKNHDHIMYGSRDMVHDGWIDRWTDGRTDRKSDI